MLRVMTHEVLLRCLEQHQADTLAAIDRAAQLLNEGPEAARARLVRTRRELARQLRDYQQFKHDRIFDPAIMSGSPSLAAAGRCSKADCIAGGQRFERYVRGWSGQDVAVAWQRFRPATMSLAADLRDHVNAEGVQIRLLLAHAWERRVAA